MCVEKFFFLPPLKTFKTHKVVNQIFSVGILGFQSALDFVGSICLGFSVIKLLYYDNCKELAKLFLLVLEEALFI